MALTSRQRRSIPTEDFADRKNRKYPLDTARQVRAAISYFSMPKNAAKYTLAKQKQMWKRMQTAAAYFGLHVSDIAGPPWLQRDSVPGSWQREERGQMATRRRRTKKRTAKKRVKRRKRVTYYVVPNDKNQGGREGWDKLRWAVKRQGSKQASRRTETQAEAIEIARGFAIRLGNSQVLVQRRDGRFKTEYTYDRDPRHIPG